MKILQLLLLILLIGCTHDKNYVDTSDYSLTSRTIIPDSLRKSQEEFIIKAVSAASLHMTAGDYEDPEDVIYEAKRTFENIHGIETEGLYYQLTGIFIPYNKLDSTQLKIFKKLKS